MKIDYTGNGQVFLIAGAGQVYTDIAARFCSSERDLEAIVGSNYNKQIVKNILDAGHYAALEFDYFLFGFAGYSRICEIQLVRKRIASYMIKSGRIELNGKRKFETVIPKSIIDHTALYRGTLWDIKDIFELIETWYNLGVINGYPEEDLRYCKPQATASKGIIGMNAHALRDWFAVRCCQNAQAEIRDLANKMLKLCKQAKPDLFEKSGAACVDLGYCPQNLRQNKNCQGKIKTHNEVLAMLGKQ